MPMTIVQLGHAADVEFVRDMWALLYVRKRRRVTVQATKLETTMIQVCRNTFLTYSSALDFLIKTIHDLSLLYSTRFFLR